MSDKQRILIADDSEMNRAILTEMLGEEYEILEAENGQQAIEMIEKNSGIDLLLLDIMMPVKDGFDVLTAMNQYHWIDELPVIMISAENATSFVERAYNLGATDYISRPFDMAVVHRRVVNTLMLYGKQKRLMQLVADQIYENEKSNSLMITILSHIVEFRNGESGMHVLHIRTFTEMILRKLITMTDKYPLTETEISLITMASALHDIGKINTPAEILNKPGKLTREEFEIMKTHTIEGDRLLDDMALPQNDPLMRTAHEICRWHHERWDGRGYPDGLKGDEIPISAQVVALADVYDALTSDRCYKKAFSHETALQMILNGECGAFNPLLLDCLKAVDDQLRTCMQHEPSSFDYQLDSQRLASEMLEQRSLPNDNLALKLLPIEQAKTEFFSEQSGGIQFVYDHWIDKAILTDWDADEAHRRVTLYLSEGQDSDLLSPEDIERIREQVSLATPTNTDVTLSVTLRKDGKSLPYTLRVRTIWPSDDGAHTYLVGQFFPAQT